MIRINLSRITQHVTPLRRFTWDDPSLGRSSGVNESGEWLRFFKRNHSLFVEHAGSVRFSRVIFTHGKFTVDRRTWMKNSFGFPARLEHRSPVKGVHSISTGYRLSVECNRPDSPCDIATTIRQSASVWSSAEALMKGLINSSRWPLIVVGRGLA